MLWFESISVGQHPLIDFLYCFLWLTNFECLLLQINLSTFDSISADEFHVFNLSPFFQLSNAPKHPEKMTCSAASQ
jgi:hypothetical protein